MTGKGPFKLLLSHKEAINIILKNTRSIARMELVDLENCFTRVLAEDIRADKFVPPFDRAAMDGYAVKAHDTYEASSFKPKILVLSDVIYAGEVSRKNLERGECTQIATGCVIPQGADAVVMLEYTKKEGNRVTIFKPVYPGANISRRGEDIEQGTVVLKRGVYLTSAKVGVLAALGKNKVKVYEKPRIAVISTGTEIREVGSKLDIGQIYDVNSHTLSSIASKHGAIVTRFGIIPDTRKDLEAAVKTSIDHDMLIFTGGSSVGERDLIVSIIQKLGKVYFHGVQVKPGKPTLFGLVNKKPVFGMPGYPTSCLSNAYLFLIPAIRRLARFPPQTECKVHARLAERVVSASGRTQFLTVMLRNGLAYPVFKHSGAITSMTEADGYIIVPVNVDVIEKGDEVTVVLFNET